MEQDDLLIAYGDNVKADGDALGGYLVRFGNPAETDLAADYFDAETDFYGDVDGKTLPILYHHGVDKGVGKTQIGTGTLKKDEIGVWMDIQLDRRNKYEQAIEKLARAGKLGLSSGAPGHMIERKAVGNARYISKWGFAEGSLTPSPAEPRIAVLGVKALEESELELVIDDAETKAEAEPETAQAVAVAAAVEGIETPARASEPSADETKSQDEPNEGGNIVDDSMIAALKSAVSEAVAPLQTKVDALEGAMKSAPAQQTGVLTPASVKSNVDPKAEFKSAFEGYARYGERSRWLRRETWPDAPAFEISEDGSVKAALAEGSGSTGGYLVPVEYDNELIQARTIGSLLRLAGASVQRLAGGGAVKKPSLTNSGAAVLTSEAGAFDESEPTFGETTWTPYKFTKLVKVSEEMLLDSRIPLQNVIAEDAANSFVLAENTAFTTGTGSSQPQGVVTGAGTVAPAAAAALTVDDLLKLFYNVGQQYRTRAVWMFNDATALYLRKLKDSNGQYLWQPSVAAGQPDTILGRPVFTNNSMADIGASAKSVLFGDLSYYQIIEWGGMEMKRLDELYAANGQVGFRWYSRFDGRVKLQAAIKVLAHPAS